MPDRVLNTILCEHLKSFWTNECIVVLIWCMTLCEVCMPCKHNFFLDFYDVFWNFDCFYLFIIKSDKISYLYMYWKKIYIHFLTSWFCNRLCFVYHVCIHVFLSSGYSVGASCNYSVWHWECYTFQT